jgi:glycerophosphoryl diester phosphodiesterase
MPIIIAQRGNVAGPSQAGENRLAGVTDALALGFGVAIDVRRTEEGQFYVSRGRQECVSGRLAEDYCVSFRAHPGAVVALSLREPGEAPDLLAMLEAERVIGQVVLIDTDAKIRSLHPRIRIAARVSGREDSFERAVAGEASIVWLDESAGPWCTERDLRRLKDARATIYAVPPDFGARTFDAVRSRWFDLIRWNVDGICTDYPAALDRLSKAPNRQTAA